MNLLDVLNAPWAIVPDKLVDIGDIYMRHVRGERLDAQAIQAAIGDRGARADREFAVVNGVAIIPITGVLAKRANLMENVSGPGATSTQLLARDFRQALEDDDVNSILLWIDSPGGTVDGTQAMANVVRKARGKKRVWALADGLMASAAYWIGSAAEKIFIADDTTTIGSIGVVSIHIDRSRALEQDGIKVTEITAGKYKRVTSDVSPLSDAGRKKLQSVVDHTYSIFVNEVSEHLGVDVDTVLEKMAEGRTFIGQNAIDVGLAHGKGTLGEIVGELIALSNTTEEERPEDLVMNNVTTSGADNTVLITSTGMPTFYNGTTTEAMPINVVIPFVAPVEAAPAVEAPEQVKIDEIAHERHSVGTPADLPSPEGEKIQTEATSAPPENTGDQEMLEQHIRDVLKLSKDENIEEALRAAARTRELISGEGENQVVSLFDHMKLNERSLNLQMENAQLKIDIENLKEQHVIELRRREAQARVARDIEEGKLTPAMGKAWGDRLAYESPKEYQAILASLPRMVNTREKGSDAVPVAMTATEEIQQAIKEKAADLRKAGGNLPSIAVIQQQVAQENPQLWESYLEEMRGLTRGRN
jgi:signal peptide peptidase SppA